MKKKITLLNKFKYKYYSIRISLAIKDKFKIDSRLIKSSLEISHRMYKNRYFNNKNDIEYLEKVLNTYDNMLKELEDEHISKVRKYIKDFKEGKC